ncbi:MAG: cardiolipin synthase [Bacteroidales bacterium]|jgi:cardiolipin synthase|nr:cardiolipin synthase [Bacteroidales bacterium]
MFLSGNGITAIQAVLAFLYVITILSICLMIVFENRNPVKTLSWLLVIIFVPVAGVILYVVFGRSYRKQKIYSRKSLADSGRLAEQVTRQMVSLPAVLAGESEGVRSKAHLIMLMLKNNRSLLTLDNRVRLLDSGSETFPAMREAISSARDYIHLEFYRIEPDMLGTEFKEMLIGKAAQGVKVRVIYDDVGSWNIGKSYLREMRSAGVQIYPFMPVRFPSFASKINYRNHRKILVVDGMTGFVGGLNLADKYLHGLPDLGPWKDTHLKLEGEAVAALDSVFISDWNFVSNESLVPDSSLLSYRKTGNRCLVQVASSGPDTDWATIMQVYFSAIATARSSIYLTSPYFSPDESMLTALKTASLSGVDVRMIFPKYSDSVIATWNTRSYISELLEAGVRIYLYEKGFIHSKYLLVDNIFASVGSPNVDVRSFDLDFEVTALVYDHLFAEELGALFFDDLKDCTEIITEDWERRRKRDRQKESMARIFGPLY